MAWVNSIAGLWKRLPSPRRSKTAHDLRTSTIVPPAEQAGAALNQDAKSMRLSEFRSALDNRIGSRDSGKSESMRAKLRSAFLHSQPVMNREGFSGRVAVLESLIRAIEDLRLHVILYGGRGIGKTSILRILADTARDARYLVISLSCGAGSSFSDFFRSAAAQIPLLYCSQRSPTSSDVESGKSLADILPEGQLSVQILAAAFAKIVGTKVIVVIDDLDQCRAREFQVSIAELLKGLSDNGAPVQFLIAGVASDLSNLMGHVPSVQRNIFVMQLHRMSPPEIREMIGRGEKSVGLKFDKAAVSGIVQAANGFPYFVSLLSSYAGMRAVDSGRSTVLLDDLLGGIEDALGQFGGRLTRRTHAQIANVIEQGQLELLGVLAGIAQIDGGHFGLDDLDARFPSLLEAAKCRQIVQSLSSHKILLAPDDQSEASSYRFLEEAAVGFIWLLYAQDQLRNNKATESGGAQTLGAVVGVSIR